MRAAPEAGCTRQEKREERRFMEPIVEVKNLCVNYTRREKESFAAVDQVSFCLYPGEVLGIVGESGCGKSTVARALTRMIPAAQGGIFLDGRDITHVRGRKLKDVYKKMQMVFQFPAQSFDPGKTLGDSIAEPLKNMGAGQIGNLQFQVRQLLLLCGLTEDFAERYPHEVSGGQCQRAAIARALAPGPQILICDEATSALDVTIQRQIMGLLQSLKETQGLSLIFICHNLALVQEFCDRVLVMHQGKIIEEGTPDQVIFSPKTDDARRLAESAILAPAATYML